MRDPRQQMGWVIYARLSPAEKAKVLGGNALRILGRCRP
jgi:predicted TIM-barrel fold metal-dependent hydrolase